MRAQMRAEVRAQELIVMARSGVAENTSGSAAHAAGSRLLETYAGLARRGEHLLGRLLQGQRPVQWAHYPDDDAIDAKSGFQWFYHSHSPQDRPAAAEHGHIHLFARRKRWSRSLRSAREMAFAKLEGGPQEGVNTRHLLAIGFDAKGLPTSLFTVNSWVTGDLMLPAQTTAKLLEHMTLDTGYAEVDAVVASVIRLYGREIRGLLQARDARLLGFKGGAVLADESLEILSQLDIDVDEKLG